MRETIALIIISTLIFLVLYFFTAKIILEISNDFKYGSRKRKILVIIALIPIINTALIVIYGVILLFIIAGMFFENFIKEVKEELKDE
jgi:hypothetical protein